MRTDVTIKAEVIGPKQEKYAISHARDGQKERGTFQGATVHAADLLPLPFTTESLDVLCANVGRVQDRVARRDEAVSLAVDDGVVDAGEGLLPGVQGAEEAGAVDLLPDRLRAATCAPSQTCPPGRRLHC